MRLAHLSLLRCPATGRELLCEPVSMEGDRVREGMLTAVGDGPRYPIRDFVPRFVPSENYARSFGLEWNLHGRTQYDAESGRPLSRKRFFTVMDCPERLEGEVILEAGSGSGRFTEIALSTGAMVVSLDYSDAVSANYASNGSHPNLLLVQASLYEMPFPRDRFDRVFCFGVLQHTPDPEAAFLALAPMARPGGWVATDLYRAGLLQSVLHPRYWVRPLTRGRDPARLYDGIRRYVDLVWPLARVIRRIPRIGPSLNWRLLVADYSRELPGADDAMLKQWAYLNTFDALSPAHDRPQRLRTYRRWHERAGLEAVHVGPGDTAGYGWSGWIGRGRRPG